MDLVDLALRGSRRKSCSFASKKEQTCSDARWREEEKGGRKRRSRESTARLRSWREPLAQGEPWFTEGGSSRESKEVHEEEIGGQEKGATGGKGMVTHLLLLPFCHLQ